MASNKPLIVYVSGNNSSGKTTLGNALARELGWQHLPAQRFDTSYLDNLFAKQRRWAFEAQSHFLLFKAGLVKNEFERKIDAVGFAIIDPKETMNITLRIPDSITRSLRIPEAEMRSVMFIVSFG